MHCLHYLHVLLISGSGVPVIVTVSPTRQLALSSTLASVDVDCFELEPDNIYVLALLQYDPPLSGLLIS